MKVFILNGMAQSGKDTFYKLVSSLTSCETFHFSIIDKIKDQASMMFGWNGQKGEKDRKRLLLDESKSQSSKTCKFRRKIKKYAVEPNMKFRSLVEKNLRLRTIT